MVHSCFVRYETKAKTTSSLKTLDMEYRFYLCHSFVPHTKWTNDCIPVLETCIEVAITMKYILGVTIARKSAAVTHKL